MSKYLKGPFTADFRGGYIFNANGDMFAEVRGWGRMLYDEGPEEIRAEHLQFMVDALNEKLARESK